jgi:hypothetical protein
MQEWIDVVRQQMPHLNKPQAVVLALWSFGMVLARSCGLTSVTHTIAKLTEQKEDTVRQRLREWNRDGPDKCGKKRLELEVSTCFVPLLRWILRWWDPQERRMVLAMDATTLGDRYVALVISVVYRACAIPIAWKVFAFDRQSAWKPEWLVLFETFREVIPHDWTVLVLADRGLYANWLFGAIRALGWHPFLRINANGKYCRQGSSQFLPLSQLVQHHGDTWSGTVTCFKANPVRATLLVCWAEPYTDPWLILTDLPTDQAAIVWYSLRAWIECGFRHIKRGGWQWHQTRMTDPARASRHWLAIAVATLWVVSVGGEVDPSLPASTLDPLPPDRPQPHAHSHPRLLSCFRLGIFAILIALIQHRPLPLGSFRPRYGPFD